MNNFIQALLIGLVYWLGTNRLWYGTTTVIRQPLVMAVPLGLIMGDIQTAMIIGGTLQLIYLGAIAPGGNIPADEAFAACVAIPIAIKTGISAEVAVSLAVPVGLLGVLLDTLRRTYASAFVRLADKAAEKGDGKALRRACFWYPFFAAIPLRVIPAFLAAYFGADAVQAFMNWIPAWVTNGLQVAGGVLPALGFAVTMIVIGKKSLLPYFLVGFIIMAYSGISTIGIAILGLCIALLQGNFAPATANGGDSDDD
jgi:D-glucosaminate-specific PTS system IIC component